MRTKIAGSIMMILLSVSVSQAQIPGTQTGLPSAHNSQECKSPDRAAWMPQANSIQAIWHFDGSGTVANAGTVASGFSGGPGLTATMASTTLAYGASSIANFRQAVTATSPNAGDYFSAGTNLTDLPAATWSFWIKAALPTGSHQRIFYKSNDNGSKGYYLILRTTGEFEFRKVHASANHDLQTCPVSSGYFANSWHHIVVTWDGTSAANSAKFYMDGTELVSTGVADTRLANAASCTNWSTNYGYTYTAAGTGGFTTDSGYPFYLFGVPTSTTTNPSSVSFAGSIDEFVIWNKVLTAAEIALVYKHQKCN